MSITMCSPCSCRNPDVIYREENITININSRVQTNPPKFRANLADDTKLIFLMSWCVVHK